MIVFAVCKPIIGMVHLGPLPGCARGGGDLDAVIESALADARALEAGGVDGIMVENYFDAPFRKDHVPPVTVAAMTLALTAVRREVGIPIGVNVLRNDVESAISIAHTCRAQFVRCNVYVGAVVSDQGIIEGAALKAVALRRELGAEIEIWADVCVKHASTLGDYPIAEQARDAVERGLADRIIVTGIATSEETPMESVRAVKNAVGCAPVFAGSGISSENAVRILSLADGAIVGTSVKAAGDIRAPIDAVRVRNLVDIVRNTH